jgi:hypothetical protein
LAYPNSGSPKVSTPAGTGSGIFATTEIPQGKSAVNQGLFEGKKPSDYKFFIGVAW